MSKTAELDNAPSLDLPRQQCLGDALLGRIHKRGPQGQGSLLGAPRQRQQPAGGPLFSVKAKELGKQLAKIHRAARFPNIGPAHLYRGRHAGASHDFGAKVLTLKEVKRRGFLRSWSSVRRYEKGARRTELMQKLSPAMFTYVNQCSGAIAMVIAGRRPALGAPFSAAFF